MRLRWTDLRLACTQIAADWVAPSRDAGRRF